MESLFCWFLMSNLTSNSVITKFRIKRTKYFDSKWIKRWNYSSKPFKIQDIHTGVVHIWRHILKEAGIKDIVMTVDKFWYKKEWQMGIEACQKNIKISVTSFMNDPILTLFSAALYAWESPSIRIFLWTDSSKFLG